MLTELYTHVHAYSHLKTKNKEKKENNKNKKYMTEQLGDTIFAKSVVIGLQKLFFFNAFRFRFALNYGRQRRVVCACSLHECA
jgi:hypothetical protein